VQKYCTYRIWAIRTTRKKKIWNDNIKMDLRDIEWGVVYWIDLAQDTGQWKALVNTVMNFRIP
jgi:hypothetical protein